MLRYPLPKKHPGKTYFLKIQRTIQRTTRKHHLLAADFHIVITSALKNQGARFVSKPNLKLMWLLSSLGFSSASR